MAARLDAAGGPWRVDAVRPQDGPALRAMFDRCSPETVRLRFFGRLRELPREYLAAALAGRPDVHDAVVAYRHGPGGRTHLAGLGSLVADPGSDTDLDTDLDADPDTDLDTADADPYAGQHPYAAAELGLLVTDACQREGAGGAMLDVLLARARARGVAHVSASVLPGRSGLLAVLARRLEPVRASRSRDGLTGVFRLAPPAAGEWNAERRT